MLSSFVVARSGGTNNTVLRNLKVTELLTAIDEVFDAEFKIVICFPSSGLVFWQIAFEIFDNCGFLAFRLRFMMS